MSRGFPSLTALLGLLAVAGYQNRDKLAELIKGATAPGGSTNVDVQQSGSAAGPNVQQAGLGGLLGGLGGGGLGGLLSGGLSDLVKQFDGSGQRDVVDSWVGTGPNKEVSPNQVEQAIGPDILDTLTQRTGLSRDELLARLARVLPAAVDSYTPQGRVPTEEEFSRS
jgi:uncharacterized protein YidB (DUF937 family)